MASIHDESIEGQYAMSPKYPLYMFNNEESAFSEFVRPDDLWYCEEPDVLDGMYEGWDSTGRHFVLAWDESTKSPRVKFVDSQDHGRSIEMLIDKISEYESVCASHGISFSESDGENRGPGRLCDPRRLRGVIKEME